MALTTVQVYQNELKKLIQIEIERLIEPMINGYVESYEDYKSLAGRIAGLKSAFDLLDEADRVCAEKYRQEGKTMPPMVMEHTLDPKEELLSRLGNIDDFKVFNNQALVAVYIRPTKTKSGIYLSDKTVDEDRYQGKVGLLVKMGSTAFQDDNGQWFNNENINLHDWLVFRPSDGWSLTVNGVLCRMLSDTQVKMSIPTPDAAW